MWLNYNEQLTLFIKSIDKIVSRFKVEESPSVQGLQYSEKDLLVRERVTSRTEMLSVIEPFTDGNNAPMPHSANIILLLG